MGRLSAIIEQIEEPKRPIAAQLVTELSFMRQQLGRLHTQIRAEGCTELFEQGKQRITRLSPAFQAYTALVSRYGQLSKQLAAMVPEAGADVGDELDAFLAGI